MSNKTFYTLFTLCFLTAACGTDTDGEVDTTEAATDSDTNTDADAGPDTDAITTAYDGFEELYILTNNDDPVDVCRVRYELHAVGTPAVSCTFCEWEVVVEKRNPTVVTDEGGACANSDLALDEAAIANAAGERIAYGFAREYVGHASILMRYNEASGQWDGIATADWDPSTSTLLYNKRDGLCAYSTADDTASSTSGICGFSGQATVSN